MLPPHKSNLIITSNRLPCVLERGENPSDWKTRPSDGGLITAMAPVLRDRGGEWIGWAGTLEEDGIDVASILADSPKEWGYRLSPVILSRAQHEGFYEGFANQIIWPLFHSLNERCRFAPRFWKMYQEVNLKFADAILKQVGNNAPFIWIHDYHLMLVAEELGRKGIKSRIGFFLHTPFPPPGMFLKLPWRAQILRGLLSYDLIGFQTYGDRRNFVECLRVLIPGYKVRGRGRVQVATTRRGETGLGVFPISIDYDEFANEAVSEAVNESLDSLRVDYANRKVILGVDRLDYTKGIPSRLKAFGMALERFPELQRRITFIQVVVPSRSNIDHYRTLKEDIDELVGEINGTYTRQGWVPIHYVFRSLSRVELLALYRRADVCLVTPLNDGMNLVAKEYCACDVEESGVLILSEFAGAAAELHRGALLVNPYDREGIADAIKTALNMPLDERKARMQRMRRYIRHHDVYEWVDSFLKASAQRGLDEFPVGDQLSEDQPADDWGYQNEISLHERVNPILPDAPQTDPPI